MTGERAVPLSYSQRYEDLHLLRAFGDRAHGFYIDVGAGHPVHDNVSFLFYLRGWRGVTVEPNPWLAELSAAVRPRDRRVQSLIGAAPGAATYYLVEHFHGLSTTVADHAEAARREFGKDAKAMTMPVTTLTALCQAHSGDIDFLKIDVEGGEQDVLLGGDWDRFRPKVVALEALAPIALTPAWEAWEPLLTARGYRFALFDGLNRYYAAEEQDDVFRRLSEAPAAFDGVMQFRTLKPAAEDPAHPDHRLAALLRGLDMVRLPLLEPAAIAAALTAGRPAAELDRPASEADVGALWARLIAPDLPAPAADLHRNATIREAYARVVATEAFRLACGRISASHAW